MHRYSALKAPFRTAKGRGPGSVGWFRVHAYEIPKQGVRLTPALGFAVCSGGSMAGRIERNIVPFTFDYSSPTGCRAECR